MVKHTQTICRQKQRNCLTVFDHFGELVFKGLNSTLKYIYIRILRQSMFRKSSAWRCWKNFPTFLWASKPINLLYVFWTPYIITILNARGMLFNELKPISRMKYFRTFAEASYLNKHVYRSSQFQMFSKIGVPINFANFSGKHLCWSLLLIKLQS